VVEVVGQGWCGEDGEGLGDVGVLDGVVVDVLAVEQFSCLAEAKVLIEDWREDYNEHRPTQRSI